MLVNEIASIVKNKVSTSELTLDNYISTDNMLPNYSGIQPSTVLPAGKATAFCPEDILLSNIRPYFRKIWFSNMHGGCNADIICLRVNSKRCVPQYLYYQLLTDNFINNYVKSCKGAKMPRGDVNKLLEYDFYCPEYEEQLRITNIGNGKLPNLIAYIDTSSVTDGELTNIQYLQDTFPSRAQRKISNGDILISSVRPNLKHNYYVQNATENMIASTGFIQIRVKNNENVDSRFLYYWLTSPSKISHYCRIADCSQSSYPSFSKEVIEELDFPSIPLVAQHSITNTIP